MKSTLMLLALGSFSFLGAAEGEEKAPECQGYFDGMATIKLEKAVISRRYCDLKARLEHEQAIVTKDLTAMARSGRSVEAMNMAANDLRAKISTAIKSLAQFDRLPSCTVSDALIRKLLDNALIELSPERMAIRINDAIVSAREVHERNEQATERMQRQDGEWKAARFIRKGAGSFQKRTEQGAPGYTQYALPNCAGVKAFFELNKNMHRLVAEGAMEHFKSKGIDCDYDSMLPEDAKK